MPEIIFTEKAPSPNGHYSQAIEHNGLVYVSGILAITPGKKEIVRGSIGDEAKQIFENFAAIIEAAETVKEKTLKVTVYLSDMSLWGEVNDIYSNFFGEHRPARAIVPIKKLHFDLNMEIEAIVAK